MKSTMEMMEEMGLHEGGIDNWVPGNAWEKFAELIIQDVLKEIYDDVQYITDFDTADNLVASVKKHFGIME